MASSLLLKTSIDLLSNGKRLRVAQLGTGPPLVLLHGYPDNLQVWSRLAPRLAARHRVIAFDWPGMGYSDAWPGGATPHIMAQQLLTVLNHWQIRRATIVGMDMGGQPALVFAARFRHRVERLVIMNSLVFSDARTSWEIRLLRKYGFNRYVLRHFARTVFRRAEATFLPRGVRLDAELRQDFWTAFARAEVRRHISKMCAGFQGTLDRLPALYTAITCPTQILWAEHDQHFPLIHAERLRQSISGSQLAVIRDGTHWMALERAVELAECVER